MTFRAAAHLDRCLGPLLRSPSPLRILVVDSSSDDGTAAKARALGVEVISVERSTFNHGTTRELARKKLGCDVIVMMSQDAYPRDELAVERLVTPIVSGDAAISYGRQVPHPGAHALERFSREFNYPRESHVRSRADARSYGAYLTFCSDAFAAYRSGALDEIGGFRRTLTHEDAIAAAMLLARGHRIAYVAEAVVEHSHEHSLQEVFRRYFAAGYARTKFRSAFSIGGPHRQLGAVYARALMRHLATTDPVLLPYAVAYLLAKWSGYAAGTRSLGAPPSLVARVSGQPPWTTCAPTALEGVVEQGVPA